MHHLNLIAATGLLASAVQAAPRALSFDGTDAEHHNAYLVDDEHSFPEVVPRSMQWAHSVQGGGQERAECPAPVLVVTTTTVDVTVYVTPEPTETMTEPPCDTETDEPRITIAVHNMTVPEPCDDDDTMMTATQASTVKVNMTMPASPSTSAMSTSQFNTTANSASTSPSRVTISIIPEHTTTPPPMESETMTPSCDEGFSWSWFNTTMATATATQDPQATDCVIDTAVTPVSTSTMTATATMPAQPTKTQCVHDEPSGKPSAKTAYCGIHGKPAGTYFIAEFIENRPGAPVTEEGCYQFCDSVMESTKGCQSYRFYNNQLGKPRCALYGRGVVDSVADLDKNQPDTWYDLACGSPMKEKWHEGMPADHGSKKARRFWF